MPTPRQTAFDVLLKIERDGAYSNLALNNAIRGGKQSGVDSAFVSALVYGVLERQITLDYIIKQYSKIPLRKVGNKENENHSPAWGFTQLLFMDKVPGSAAVKQGVILAKKAAASKSAGFIKTGSCAASPAPIRHILCPMRRIKSTV